MVQIAYRHLVVGRNRVKSLFFTTSLTRFNDRPSTHRWTGGGNAPSAKLTTWNEAMLFFTVAPPGYRKLLVVLHDLSLKGKETLGGYYVRTHSHIIPEDVEVWEYHEGEGKMTRIK